ncbi:MAG: aminotransferase class IV [Desulforhopalus sp.]
MNTFYVNGNFVEEDKALIPVTDLSVLRGFGVFDFLRTYNGRPFHLADHLNRLTRSAKMIGLLLPHPVHEIEQLVLETLRRNDHVESHIRLVVTGGQSLDGITPGDSPLMMIMVTEASMYPGELFSKGVRVITSHLDRSIPGAKTIHYISAIMCQKEAHNRDAVEAIYVDRDGLLQEGTTSNFFGFIGNRLITPPADRVLPGITRQIVLELAEKEFNIVERQIHKDEIRLLDEAFITSSTKEVMPVRAIDSITLNFGRVGDKAGRVMKLFKDYTVQYKG